ncbi:MAG: cytochrome c3 family protein, partial [Raoultibacter sp.]
ESSENAKCLASKHADLSCIQCHTDTSTLSTAHANATADGKMPKTLKATTVDEAVVCESCHNREEIAAITASSTVLTDENGTVVNPHALSASESHAEVTCTSCHKMHSSTDSAKSAQRACTSCHHTNVYECNTCHAA